MACRVACHRGMPKGIACRQAKVRARVAASMSTACQVQSCPAGGMQHARGMAARRQTRTCTVHGTACTCTGGRQVTTASGIQHARCMAPCMQTCTRKR
jgi:hypothetical protein